MMWCMMAQRWSFQWVYQAHLHQVGNFLISVGSSPCGKRMWFLRGKLDFDSTLSQRDSQVLLFHLISIAFNENRSREVSERKVQSNPSLVVRKLVYHFPLELEALSAWGQGCKVVRLFIMFHPRVRDISYQWPVRWKNRESAFQQVAFSSWSSKGNFWGPQTHEEGRLKQCPCHQDSQPRNAVRLTCWL